MDIETSCPFHGRRFWYAYVTAEGGYCIRCREDTDKMDTRPPRLGDVTGDEHNGAGCYDSDIDMS